MPAAMPIDFSKMPIIEMTPEKVARTGLRALGHQASIVPGLLNKIFVFENRFMPRSWPVKLFGFLLKRSWEKREAGGGAQVSQT
jgi:short-subunit dehydrogenase